MSRVQGPTRKSGGHAIGPERYRDFAMDRTGNRSVSASTRVRLTPQVTILSAQGNRMSFTASGFQAGSGCSSLPFSGFP